MRQTKIASSGSIEELVKLLNQFWYTNSVRIENGQVFNSKGLIQSVIVSEKRGRFTALFIH